MNPSMVQIFQLPSSRFKVYIWGHADIHVSDWNGCNYRITPATGQPLRGYKTAQEAKVTYDAIVNDPERKKAEFARASYVSGMFLGDRSKLNFVDVTKQGEVIIR